MQHEEHTTSHTSPGFGTNTSGMGILVLVVIFVALGLFTWSLWNNDHAELKHYRIEASASHEGGHDAGHDAEKHEAEH